MGKRVKTRKPGDPRFPVLKDIYPKAFMLVGGFLILAAVVSFPSALRIYQSDSALRDHGTTASAVVERVDVVHHTGRRSSWYEHIPVVKFQIDGRDESFRLRDYSSASVNEFTTGEKLTVMYDPAKPYLDPGIKDDKTRSHIVRKLVQSSILGGVGSILFVVGTPVVILRARQKKAEQRRLEAEKRGQL